MQSTHTAYLNMLTTPRARNYHIVPSLKNSSLLSIGKFCDKGYVAISGKRHLHIFAMDEVPPNSAFQVP